MRFSIFVLVAVIGTVMLVGCSGEADYSKAKPDPNEKRPLTEEDMKYMTPPDQRPSQE